MKNLYTITEREFIKVDQDEFKVTEYYKDHIYSKMFESMDDCKQWIYSHLNVSNKIIVNEYKAE